MGSPGKDGTPSWRRYVESYKGTSFPSPFVPLAGLALGSGIPYVLMKCLNESVAASLESPMSLTDRLQVLAKCVPLVALLGISEFILGAAARATSPKASASPAAVQAMGQAPFAIVQANRIFQNHIESAFMYWPMLLGVTSFCDESAPYDMRVVPVMAVSWLLFRFVYRIGYISSSPFNRITGTTACMIHVMMGGSYSVYRFTKTFF
eukprot:m.175336 g.175336  ORF g.175336 m.175336 type:complete len:207 (+) comp15422_c0_seq9:64-684(+)